MSVNNSSDREFIEEYEEKADGFMYILGIIVDPLTLILIFLLLFAKIFFISLPIVLAFGAIISFFSDLIILSIILSISVWPFGKLATKTIPTLWDDIKIFYNELTIPNLLHERKAFQKKFGMNEITAYKHYKFINNKVIYMPWIQQVCKMNPSAQYNQTILIKDWYEMDDSIVKEYVFDNEYSNSDIEFYTTRLLSKDLPIRKTFIDRLFKLAIVQDGIHNDEWKLLMQIVADFKFNKNYINLFIRRYGPLRTEFEDERKDSTSTGERTVAYLNPYYAVLGLDNSASEEEIKKAYHALALEHHPDLPKNAGRIQECEEMMAKINEAYEKIRG